MSYTKGKWLVMGNQRKGHFDFVLPLADDKDFQANARLIAAAPDLLEALKDILQQAGLSTNCPSYLKMKQAIAKAEGAK